MADQVHQIHPQKHHQPAEVEEKPLVAHPVEEPKRHRITRAINDFSPTLRNEVECDNPYASYAPKPRHVSFESQDAQERIVLFVRRHFVTQLYWIIGAIILALLPLALQFVPLLDFFPERFHLIMLIGWYVFILGYVLENFLMWFFNVNILTDERIVDIDFYSLLYKKITTAQLERIEDVTSVVGGFLGSILNYGTVDIQTAAEQREISFELIPQPQKVVKILNELQIEEKQEELEGRAR